MKILLYISLIVIMLVSFLLVKEGSTFPFTISFCVIPIIITGHLYGATWAYLASIVLTAFCIGLTKLGLKFTPMAVSIICFNAVPLVVYRFNSIFKKYQQDCRQKVAQAEDAYKRLLSEDKELKSLNAQLERDVLEMARLYEITKAMSTSLDFSGIYSVLKNVLEKTFKFGSARLILVSERLGLAAPVIQKIYKMQSINSGRLFEEEKLIRLTTAAVPFLDNEGRPAILQGEGDLAEPADFDRQLVGLYPAQERTPLVVRAQQADLVPERLKLPPGVKTFAAVGLFSENTPVGILAVENIAEEEMERFLIVASQFELELQKVKLYEMVQQLAIMDGLTGMFVRRYLLERCQDELRRSIKHKLSLSCLIVDIDFFKDCNDKYGHLVGDVILKQLAEIIKDNIREVDFVGRYGGEEFCVILPDTPKNGGVHVAERLRTAVQEHIFKAYDESIKITVSIGATVFPDDASDLNQLIDSADQAMYKAKKEGRNKVCTGS